MTPNANEEELVHVIERESKGVYLAYAVRWNKFFCEWEFLRGDRFRDSETKLNRLGTCVEGIRIEFDSPGYIGTSVIAIANVKGLNAPKTNVARSGIEATPERDASTRVKFTQIYLSIGRRPLWG